jgi:hypothetical protein
MKVGRCRDLCPEPMSHARQRRNGVDDEQRQAELRVERHLSATSHERIYAMDVDSQRSDEGVAAIHVERECIAQERAGA